MNIVNKDHDAAMIALIAWFKSQDIMPTEATSIMIRLIANQLTTKTKDIDTLQVAANAARDMLMLDIASYLR